MSNYIAIRDIISDLNVMIVEAPIPNDVRYKLANIVADLKDIDPDEDWGERGIDYQIEEKIVLTINDFVV